jgi:hypothetical protein
MAVLSVNLGLMNILPIPVLDGGAFLFCFIELIRGKPAPDRIRDFATRAGVAAIFEPFSFTQQFHNLAGLGVFNWILTIANAANGAHIVPN